MDIWPVKVEEKIVGNNVGNPQSWPYWVWLLAIIMAVSGGAINCIDGSCKKGNLDFVRMLGELFISGFVGITAFMLLEAYNFPIGVCAAIGGISGHMGTRFLFLVENMLERRLIRIAEENEADDRD